MKYRLNGSGFNVPGRKTLISSYQRDPVLITDQKYNIIYFIIFICNKVYYDPVVIINI
jgi:hypothetical protein